MKKLLVLLCVFVISSCGGSGSSSVPVEIPAPVVDTPDTTTYPGVSWETALPEDVGMSEARIKDALDYAFVSTRNTQGVVIIRHGVIVGERYANNDSKESLATSWSTGKSFASA